MELVRFECTCLMCRKPPPPHFRRMFEEEFGPFHRHHLVWLRVEGKGWVLIGPYFVPRRPDYDFDACLYDLIRTVRRWAWLRRGQAVIAWHARWYAEEDVDAEYDTRDAPS